ncbi:MAG: hypothetical protein KBS85_01370 [Lachnospiraceae bacterium]|nr:hypothetical protein [Candidatus Merdinaster equi]
MKQLRRGFAFVISLIMVAGLLGTMLVLPVKADGEETENVSFTLKLSIADGSQAPGNFGIGYRVMESDGTRPVMPSIGEDKSSADGSSITITASDISIPKGSKIQLEIRDAGYEVVFGGNVVRDMNGKLYSLEEINGQTIELQLRQASGGGKGDGDGAHGTQVDCNMTINWSGSFGEIRVGDIRLSDVQGKTSGSQTLTRVTVDESNNVKIELQADFTRVFSSIKIDGSEKVTGDKPEVYEFTVSKDTESVSIAVEDAASDYFTIVWSYNPDDFGPDAYVQNGQVEVLSGYTDGNPGHYRVKKGDTVRVKLLPSYGYQVVGARINGVVELTACAGTNEFEFVMPSTNVHFQGIFTKTADIVNCSADAVASASLGNGSAVAGDGGSAKMTVSSGTAADTSNVTSGSVDASKSVQAVNITMEQVFYKNTADSVWTTPKSELSGNAEVRLQVNQQAEGYAVLREHGGQITQIPASYDPETKMLIFASSQYSNYTLVPLTEANNDYAPEDPENGNEGKQDTPSEEASQQVELVSSENTQEEQIKKLEQQETEKEIQTVVVDTTGVKDEAEQVIPQETFNLSTIKTVKGFVCAIQKVLDKAEKLEYVTATTAVPKPVSIYTEKPVCFNKTIAAAFTNAKMDVVYYFTYKGHLYSVTIPAGTDLKAIMDKVPYAGPLYIGYILGTSQIIK